MIAKPNQCDPQQLALMLEDQLDLDAQHEMTDHLDHCPACRQHLEEIAAGGGDWWSDTREALADLTETERQTIETASQVWACGSELGALESGHASSSHPPSVISPSADIQDHHWVVGLLEPPTEGHPIGLGNIDGMPVHSVIGQGGMGVVLMARDHQLHRNLAIKLLSPMLASTGAARQRFLREAQAAASVVHPNIVPIYAVSAERKLPYIVMPYVAGGNLQQLLDDEGPLAVERVLSIGLQVAEGLVAAHQQGIVHRDIKPANLMLDEGGFRVMITDFGLARALDDSTLTGSGMLAGTPQFMSPEQAAGRNLDHRSDIYSLGAVLYALATGRPPIRGTSTLETLRHIMEESPKPIVEINESYPAWFQELVDRFMTKDVDRRIQTAEDAAELLRSCLAHARAPAQTPLPTTLRRRTAVSSSWIVAGALTCILLLALFVTQAADWLPKWGRAGDMRSEELTVGSGAVGSGVAGSSLATSQQETNIGQPERAELSVSTAKEVDLRIDAAERELASLQAELEGDYLVDPDLSQEDVDEMPPGSLP